MLRRLLGFVCCSCLLFGFPSCGEDEQRPVGLQAISCGGRVKWVRPLSGVGAARVRALAPLADGGFFAAGDFDGTLSLLDREGKVVALHSAGGQDAFLLRLDATARAVWGVRVGGAADDAGLALAVLGDGAVVLGGTFRGSARFGVGDKTETVLTTAHRQEGFVAWFSPTGRLERALSLGSQRGAAVVALAALPDDTVMAAGSERAPVSSLTAARARAGASRDGSATSAREAGARWWEPLRPPPGLDARETLAGLGFAPQPLRLSRPPAPVSLWGWAGRQPPWSTDELVLREAPWLGRFTREGARAAVPTFGVTGSASLAAVVAPASGGLVVAGRFSGALDVGGVPKARLISRQALCAGCVRSARELLLAGAQRTEGASRLWAEGAEDAFVARFDAGGRLQWASRAASVAVTDDDAVWVAAVARGASANGEALESLVLLRAGQGSAELVARRHAEAPSLRLAALAAVPGDGVALVGSYRESLRIFLGAVTLPFGSVGGEEVFLARFDASGAPMWMRQVTGADEQVAGALAAMPEGELLVGGAFAGTTSFAGGPDGQVRTAEGPRDGFLMLVEQ